MILPIVAYGAPILRKVSQEVDPGYPGLHTLIEDMWETMYYSNGVGLAAPQINRPIRLFVVDSLQVVQHLEPDEKALYPNDEGLKMVFINPKIIGLNGTEFPYNEGCLSIPKIREDVVRPAEITLAWMDENFNSHQNTFYGVTARILQHEYDHLEGKLFIDYLSPLKRKLLKGKLLDISKGKIKTDYRMIHPMNG